jgi:hypothetical protein
MNRTVILSVLDVDQEAVEARAAHVGADILARYRQLAMDLRQIGWSQVADLNAVLEPAERAARRCAFQLYSTAASELDDIVSDLLDDLVPGSASEMQARTLRLLDGGKAGDATEDGPVQ